MNGPLSLILILGWACNSRCVFCIREPLKRARSAPAQWMDVAMVEAALLKYRPSLQGVTLSSFGETTMHPEFDRIVGLMSRMSYVHIITNGSRPESLKGIAQLPGTIVFSIDAPVKETYEELRVGLSFDDVVRSLDGFVRGTRHINRDVGINMVVFERNVHQVYDMAHFASDHGVSYLNIIAGMGSEGIEVTGGGVSTTDSRVLAQILRARADFSRIKILCDVFDFSPKPACIAPWTSLDIDPDGDAHPCCRAYAVNLGHCVTASPWESPKMSRLRSQLHAHVIDPAEFKDCFECPWKPA